jgi:hypothetical protein
MTRWRRSAMNSSQTDCGMGISLPIPDRLDLNSPKNGRSANFRPYRFRLYPTTAPYDSMTVCLLNGQASRLNFTSW